MIIAHYAHRLPANYETGLIRSRAQERGPEWSETPGLYFKAFLLREKGHFGAVANDYSSLYLWQGEEALGDFLAGDRFKVVTDSFGRPEVHTHLALDAKRGRSGNARFAYTEELDIPRDADLPTVFAQEVARNREVATHAGAVATTVGVDSRNWRLIRVLLSENEPDGRESGTPYQILHLARPLLASVP